ncbi:MAG: oligosaccharide flippase family protein, partial [Eubacterium sp.]|nr:oligosaccharide flippase family protein [Eubacterium sp.]
MKQSIKQRYITSAFILLIATVVVKVISAVYKIPLTSYIGATGRGYFTVAYNLCMPVHALTMGAFPLALTKLVSAYEAKGDRLKVKALRKASQKLFFIVGFAGLAVMLIMAKPYANLISSSPKSIYTILALAPSVFFSCLCASHRAFAEGFLDMNATAISQTIEAFFKMIFGLLFARLSMTFLLNSYIDGGTVLGINAANEEQALAQIYPITSAVAMLGVTLGSIASYIFAAVYTRIKYNFLPQERVNAKTAYNELLTFSAGLVGATVVQSIANFIDTSSLQYCLSLCNADALSSQYVSSGDDIYTYVLGIYAVALDFRNLIPAIVMALGVTAVPAVSTAFESGQERFSSLLTSIF